ncbi:HK97-gp10 family putative phage morphogenesis protein [Sinorhizobium fredii]|uniref:HK97-gp10 family putative phage morphogenesis protein n=1 Tax=Rhizobium fredii TaxID=380 RepID=UPI0004AFE357|nr:HK97-gp10 family putative phage morphogenesis protein [Sinorhizobium fredii]
MLKIKVNSDEIVAALERDTKYLAEKEMRGVVAEAANVIRDDARQNAIEVGYSAKGPHRMPSGSIYWRKGQIPDGIYAFVEANKGTLVSAKIAFDAKKAGGAWYAHILEFGSRFMSPVPFFMRALPEKQADAIKAAQKRLSEAVGRMLK